MVVFFSVFKDFGDVKKVKNQTCLWNNKIFTGTSLVLILLNNSTLPRGLTIDGYPCCVWYKGQPLVCNLCNIQGHKSPICPNKDKCHRCGEQGHYARNCPRALGPSLASSGEDPVASSVPSGGGLGIVNFQIKADALKLASVVSLCCTAYSRCF